MDLYYSMAVTIIYYDDRALWTEEGAAPFVWTAADTTAPVSGYVVCLFAGGH